MKVLDLFSGIGGFSLGLERAGMETIAFCEFDKKAQLVLKKHWPDVPIYDDVRKLTWKKFVQDAKKRKLEAAEELPHTANHATQNSNENIGQKTKADETGLTGRGVKKRRKKYSNTMAGNASVVEKQKKNFSASTTSKTTETQKEGNISHKHGSSLLNEGSPMTTKSFATTAITQNHTTGSAHTEEFRVDVITAGVPCQPASQAGKRGGESDNRWLWPEALRIISEFHPRWAILENVYGFLTLDNGMAFDKVCIALEAEGYSIQTFVIPACAVNAPHRRDRVWIICHSEHYGSSTTEKPGSTTKASNHNQKGKDKASQSKGTGGRTNNEDVAYPVSGSKGSSHRSRASRIADKKQNNGNQLRNDSGDSGETLAHATGRRQSGQGKSVESIDTETIKNGETVEPLYGGFSDQWAVEPELGRVAHGIPNRVDRLKQLGNAVVPQVVEQIGRAIMKIERE